MSKYHDREPGQVSVHPAMDVLPECRNAMEHGATYREILDL
jgi:hypothetical protein